MRCCRLLLIMCLSPCTMTDNKIPLEKYKENLLKMFDAIKRYHNLSTTEPRVVLLNPPPIDEPLVLEHLPDQFRVRARENTHAYSRAVMELAVPPFVEKVDFHEAVQLAQANEFLRNPRISTGDDTNPHIFVSGGTYMSYEDYLSDGVHLKDPSYKILYSLVTECIHRRWPEITPGQMIMPVLWWGDIVKNQRARRDKL
jgi:lysophospholipase L1-like esterase